MGLWFPGISLTVPLSGLEGARSRRYPKFFMIATFFNSGRHLYWSQDWPRWYYENDPPLAFVSYRHFRGCGRLIGEARIQHFGHLYGLNGGSAQVAVEYAGRRWEICCLPHRIFYVVDIRGQQMVAMSKRPVTLPRALLSHG